MWELDHKEGWALKNWWFWTMVSEITLESPSDCKEIKPVNPKGNQPWIFVDRLMLKLKSPLLWPPDTKSLLIERDPDAGKDWRQEEIGTTEDEMIGWHYQLNGHEFEQTPEDGEGQGSLVCCSSWGFKESDTTEQLNWNHADSHLITAYCCQYFERIIFAIVWSSMDQIYQGWSDSKKCH